ncbi:hypothetical protein BKI52_29125 [marine bacterium AO1-C]|nr:hypothetical protein BKI52_29125 [marine bacterium AO1-C]
MKEILKAYNQQKADRGLLIEEFRELLMLFPVIEVLRADGQMDMFEKHYFHDLIKKHHEENPHFNYYIIKEEITYVLDNFSKVEPILYDALKELNQNEDLSNYILDSMLTAARVSSDDLKTNLIYSEVPGWLKLPRTILAVFLTPNKDKTSISEEEKSQILTVLERVGGVSERNLQVLNELS